jgi:hypothetical protein
VTGPAVSGPPVPARQFPARGDRPGSFRHAVTGTPVPARRLPARGDWSGSFRAAGFRAAGFRPAGFRLDLGERVSGEVAVGFR